MKKSYKKLELDKILLLLSEKAVCEPCKEKILRLKPCFDLETAREEMAKTDDAFTLSVKFGTPGFYNIKDITGSAKRAQQGGILSLRELLDISAVLREISGLCTWYSHCENIESKLSEYFSALRDNKRLLSTIESSVLNEDELSDSASPELSSIRRAIRKKSTAVREQLDKLIHSSSQKKYLQESLVTIRDGRFCVPVKTEYRSEINGLVHDSSASGQTLFIEPMAVVEAGNDIRLLKSREAEETERIIKEMSRMVGDFCDDLLYSYQNILTLEIYFAKANLAASMKAVTPKIIDKPSFKLLKARHPLISPEKIVPITVELGTEYNSLIVTGPNTGGKTVSLKTAGLLILMAMCGMMIPAADGSEIGIFDDIFVDIGDEQSIEQNLSTFSSHITNISRIMKSAGESSLVLLDELCSGTDPVEGSALAVAVLHEMHKNGVKVMATTHYQEVKLYAIETEGVENASCEFDVKTLKPTYNFMIGVPGMSNAFAISSRLGIEGSVIDYASSLISSENRRFERIISELEAARREAESLKAAVNKEKRRAEELTRDLEEQRKRLEAEKEKELEATRRKSQSIIEEVRFRGDLLLEELENLRKQKEAADFAQRIKSAKSHANSAVNEMYDTANPVNSVKLDHYVLPRPLKIGDTVILADSNSEGTLSRLPDAKNICMVTVGNMKIKTSLENLRLKEVKNKPDNKKKPASGKISKKVTGNATRKSGMELDIRGMMSDEGIMEVDRFIDGCLISGISVITIIHGKGTGALRTAVQQYLRRNPHVKSFRDGVFGEGDMGVTVAELG